MRFQPILLSTVTITALFGISLSALAQSTDGIPLTPKASESSTTELGSDSECKPCTEASAPSDNTFAGSTKSARKAKLGKHAAGKFAKIEHGPMSRLKAIKSLESLTADQTQQMDAILESFRQEAKPLRDQLIALRKSNSAPKLTDGKSMELKTAATSKSTDNQENQTQVQEIRQQLKTKARDAMQKVFALLTPEQKEQLRSQSQITKPSRTQKT